MYSRVNHASFVGKNGSLKDIDGLASTPCTPGTTTGDVGRGVLVSPDLSGGSMSFEISSLATRRYWTDDRQEELDVKTWRQQARFLNEREVDEPGV